MSKKNIPFGVCEPYRLRARADSCESGHFGLLMIASSSYSAGGTWPSGSCGRQVLNRFSCDQKPPGGQINSGLRCRLNAAGSGVLEDNTFKDKMDRHRRIGRGLCIDLQ